MWGESRWYGMVTTTVVVVVVVVGVVAAVTGGSPMQPLLLDTPFSQGIGRRTGRDRG